MWHGAVLFYKTLISHLDKIGLELNSYEQCVANTMINSSQITLFSHIDYINVSHKEESAVYVFVLKICKIFRNSTKVSRGKVHEYLGMDINWSQDGSMIVSIIKYLQKIIGDLPEVICCTSATYVEEHLLQYDMRRTGSCRQSIRHRTSIKLYPSCYYLHESLP